MYFLIDSQNANISRLSCVATVDVYMSAARAQGLARVLAGVDLALQLGYRPLKLNTVLIRGERCPHTTGPALLYHPRSTMLARHI